MKEFLEQQEYAAGDVPQLASFDQTRSSSEARVGYDFLVQSWEIFRKLVGKPEKEKLVQHHPFAISKWPHSQTHPTTTYLRENQMASNCRLCL